LAVQEDGGFFAAVDPMLTPELRREGWAREVISRVQRMRKESGLAVSDRITVLLAGGEDVKAVVGAHGAWIAGEVLATELVYVGGSDVRTDEMQTVDLDGTPAYVAITRIA
jgi:isoleucyl-tRNA synthetase